MHNKSHSFFKKLLSRFTYPQKFLFISLLFGFALVVVGFFMIRAQNLAINFSTLELKGNNYQRHLRQLLESIPKHQLMINRLMLGKTKLQGGINDLQAKINVDFERLEAMNQELEDALQTSSEDFQVREVKNLSPMQLKEQWSRLIQAATSQRLEASAALHQQLIDEVRALIVHVGDTSNLILDPDVDTYYLMDSTLIRLPEQQYLIPQIISLGERAILNKKLTLEERTILANYVSLLRSNVAGTNTGITKAYLEDRNLKKDFETQNKLKSPLKNYVDVVDQLLKYITTNILNVDEIVVDSSELAILGRKSLDASFHFWDLAIKQMDRLLRIRIQKFKDQQRYSILLSGFAAFFGLFLGLFIMREISRAMKTLIEVTRELSSGNLSARVPVTYTDELGLVSIAFNQMGAKLEELIGQLQRSGIKLTTATTEIAASAKEQETIIVEQESTTKEIAATAKQISATSREFAKTMSEVTLTADETAKFAISGKDGLNQMEAVMNSMVKASGNIASRLAVLNEKAVVITNIITTITKVADQTNLLSLNASIEAEKAGEHGRSFSVIAREIRRLADQTANATLDIENMINEMMSAVSEGVMSVDSFQQEILRGVEKVSSVGELLTKIIEQVQAQTSSFENVNEGMQSQSLGAEQIKEAIDQLSEAAKHATDSIQQFQRSIHEMKNSTHEMREAVNKIKK